MPMHLATIALGGFLLAAAHDGVPTLDTRPTCAGAENDGFTNRTVASCQRSEQQARDSLTAQWERFPAADKHDCVAATSVGGFPSYVQVLVCLELARDARSERAAASTH